MGFDIVTGGAGFIGSHLVEALRKYGRDVLVIDTNHSDPKNINDFGHKKFTNKIDTVFHLAALADIVPSIQNPRAYYETNVTGTFNILEMARNNGCRRFIYAASASCYGDTITPPTPERSGVFPKYPYALTKYLGERLVMHWARVYGIPAVSLRLFNVYGLRSRTSGAYGAMFGTFLAQMANDTPVTIVGDGTQKRDFVHVSDVCRAFIMASNSNKTGIYNVGSGQSYSVNEIVRLLDAQEKVHIPERPGEPYVTCADISRIRSGLGWQPRVSIEEGIKELLYHIKDWKEAPVWTPDAIKEATKEWFECLG